MNKQDFLNAMNKVNISSEAEQRIMSQAINFNQKKESVTMSKKKIGIIAVAATLVMGIAAYASSEIIASWNGSSSSTPEYTSLPTTEEIVSDIGYAPVLIEEFENGYVFDNASIVRNDLRDDSGESVEKFKSVTMRYEKGNDKVLMSADRFNSEMEASGEVVANIDGIDINYDSYTNKVVPPDYELTEEDKKAEENGELVFSYGSSDVSVSEVQNLSWEQNGIHYSFTCIDNNISVDELVNMAKEIIAAK